MQAEITGTMWNLLELMAAGVADAAVHEFDLLTALPVLSETHKTFPSWIPRLRVI